jgi:hypothetical protein
MPTARVRNLDARKNVSGTCYWNIRGTKASARPEGLAKNCQDTVGNRDGVNAFELVSNFTVQPYLDGKMVNPLNGQLLREFNHYPIDWPTSPVATTSKFPNPTLLEQNNIAWQVLAKSNPSAAHVSLPSYYAELKDLPQLAKELRRTPDDIRRFWKAFTLVPLAIRHWGDSLLRRIATGHLSWRWAIKPMIGDLMKMIDFCGAVNKRFAQLDRLQQKGFIRSRVNLGRSSIEDAPVNTIIHSDLDTWKANRITKYTSEMWATVQWNTTGLSMIPFDGASKLNLARRLTYGITGYEALQTLWEIYPWSWLVDWFTGVGTVLQAHNNTLFLTHTKSCLMRRTTSKTRFELTQAGTWSQISGMPVAEQTRLQRWPIAPILPFAPTAMPLLDGGKWSILASLYVLGHGRRKLPR